MLKKTVKYKDFNGDVQSEVLYFNLTEPEVVRLDVEFPGGLKEYIENLSEENPQDILNLFEKVIRESYGKKSEDGRRFIKSEKAAEEFYQSAAYSSLFVELARDADKAAAFITALLSTTTVGE